MGEAILGNFVMAFVSIAVLFGFALFALVRWLSDRGNDTDE